MTGSEGNGNDRYSRLCSGAYVARTLRCAHNLTGDCLQDSERHKLGQKDNRAEERIFFAPQSFSAPKARLGHTFAPSTMGSGAVCSMGLVLLLLGLAIAQPVAPFGLTSWQLSSRSSFPQGCSGAVLKDISSSVSRFRDSVAWYNATIPATVMGALQQSNTFDDPYYADNIEKIHSSWFTVPWNYMTVRAFGFTRFFFFFKIYNSDAIIADVCASWSYHSYGALDV